MNNKSKTNLILSQSYRELMDTRLTQGLAHLNGGKTL